MSLSRSPTSLVDRQSSATSADAAVTPVQDLEAAIRLDAYARWEAAGRPPGDGMNFWLEAEREIRGESSGSNNDCKEPVS